MEYKTVNFEKKDDIAIVTINRPDVLNALIPDVLNDLLIAVKEVENDKDVKVLILTGKGRAFVAGADIAIMKDFSVKEALEFTTLGHRVMNSLEEMSKPVLAAVNGFALGGGMELSLACDFIYASKIAKFGQPEISLGIVPGFGGTQRLAYAVGINKARELIYTGDMIDAEEAKRIGLVAEIFEAEELLDKVIEKAKLIITKGPCALTIAKRIMNKGRGIGLQSALELEMQAFSALFGTEDQKEGMSAFVGKRKAVFNNR